MKSRIFAILMLVITLTSCGASKDLSKAYNMSKCKYNYNSVSNITIMDMNVKNGLNIMQIPRVTALLAGKSRDIPVSLDVNIDVHNPNQSPASLAGLDYVVLIDGVEFTSGRVNQMMEIQAGGTELLALTFGFNLGTLIDSDAKDSVQNAFRNLTGLGTRPSDISLQIRPTIMIKGTPIQSPVFIPINFSYGGKK